MKLFDAFEQVINEDDDPLERAEFSADIEIKTQMIEELREALKEMQDAKIEISDAKSAAEAIKPLFDIVAFFFIAGIRVGKILRDAEVTSDPASFN